jgi:LytS/YehU family sensor histidine kinase
MVQLLSDFLRGTLSREKEKMMPLSEEINYLNLYLEIEKVRFGHRLNIDFQIDENCQKFLLPSLILQPIVENAIKYGLYGSTENVTISVKSVCKPHALEISISNPYTKENEKTSKGLGFGLNSIQRKLYLLYGQNDLMIINKGETQFTTTLIIPQI